MKDCEACGKTVFRQEPDNAEYGVPVVDGRRYPDNCPRCGEPLDEEEE